MSLTATNDAALLSGFISIHLRANPTPHELSLARNIIDLVEETKTDSEASDVFQPEAPPVPGAQPAPLAPSVAIAQPAVLSTAVELDAEGYPWDARINAGTKTKTEKGVYKKLKGLPDPTYIAVRAELCATYPLPASAAPVAPPPPVAVAPPAPVAPAAPLPPVAVAPPAPVAPAAPLPPVQTIIPPTIAPGALDPRQPCDGTFPGLLRRWSALQQSGLIPTGDLPSILTGVGAGSIGDAATRPDILAAIDAMFTTFIAGK